MTRHLLSVAITVPEGLAEAEAAHLATMAERLGFTTVRDADLPDHGVVRINDPSLVAEAQADLDAGEEVLVAVPISIGRTHSEALARADREARFAGERHPERVGIFGTFEEGQEQVLALARAGAGGLVLDVPLERDVADVLAQIRALVVGATPHLVANGPSERSAVAPTVFYGEGWTPPEE